MKKGDRVKIFNSTMSGKQFVEGMATLIKREAVYSDDEERWLVRFDNDAEDEVYSRFITKETDL